MRKDGKLFFKWLTLNYNKKKSYSQNLDNCTLLGVFFPDIHCFFFVCFFLDTWFCSEGEYNPLPNVAWDGHDTIWYKVGGRANGP